MAHGEYTKRREKAAAIVTPPCALCPFPASRFDPARREATHRGKSYFVCGPCRRRYSHAVGQIERYGFRFRFVEKAEIPRSPCAIAGQFAEVYKLLLLSKERQEKLGKEVMWMPEDMTQKVLKLPRRVAAAMKNTYAVRGDDATESDDVALQKIKDLIEEIDPNVFSDLLRRNKKRLS